VSLIAQYQCTTALKGKPHDIKSATPSNVLSQSIGSTCKAFPGEAHEAMSVHDATITIASHYLAGIKPDWQFSCRICPLPSRPSIRRFAPGSTTVSVQVQSALLGRQ
jgi:hypothetical protein